MQLLRLYSHNLAYKGLWWFFSRIIEAVLHVDTPIGSFLEAWLGVIHGVWGNYGESSLQYPSISTSSQHASTQNSMKSFQTPASYDFPLQFKASQGAKGEYGEHAASTPLSCSTFIDRELLQIQFVFQFWGLKVESLCFSKFGFPGSMYCPQIGLAHCKRLKRPATQEFQAKYRMFVGGLLMMRETSRKQILQQDGRVDAESHRSQR